MKLNTNYMKCFRKNDGAVSPVLGVVLMIAITAILAAAVCSSVLEKTPIGITPQANIIIKAGVLSGDVDESTIILEHLGGDPIDFDANITKISAIVSGTAHEVGIGIDTTSGDPFSPSFVLSVGDTQTVILNGRFDEIDIEAGDTIKIQIIDIASQQLIYTKGVTF